MADDEEWETVEGDEIIGKFAILGGKGNKKIWIADGDRNLYECDMVVPGSSVGSSSVTKRRRTYDGCDGGGCGGRKKGLPSKGVGIYTKIPKELDGLEIKTVDHWTGQGSSDIAVLSEPHWVTLNAIRQGDSYYERDGSKVVMKSVRIFYRFQLNDNGISRGDVLRLLVIYDRNPSNQFGKGITPQKSTVIAAVSATGATRHTSEDNMNPTQSQRFIFLKDLKIYMSNDGNGITDDASNGGVAAKDPHAMVASDFEIELGGPNGYLTTRYRPHEEGETNPSIEQIMNGALFMMIFGLHQEDGGWNVHYSTRLQYVDL